MGGSWDGVGDGSRSDAGSGMAGRGPKMGRDVGDVVMALFVYSRKTRVFELAESQGSEGKVLLISAVDSIPTAEKR